MVPLPRLILKGHWWHTNDTLWIPPSLLSFAQSYTLTQIIYSTNIHHQLDLSTRASSSLIYLIFIPAIPQKIHKITIKIINLSTIISHSSFNPLRSPRSPVTGAVTLRPHSALRGRSAPRLAPAAMEGQVRLHVAAVLRRQVFQQALDLRRMGKRRVTEAGAF